MRILLNDYEINNAANKVYLDDNIQGLELPDIRTSGGNRSGQPGSYFGAQIFDARYISLPGRIFSSSVSEAKQKRRELQAALPLYPDVITMKIFDDDGYVYVIDCQLKGFKMPITREQVSYAFKIDLEASDPAIYDASAGSALSFTINKVLPGGMYFSTTTPQFGVSTYFSAGQTNAMVNNPGAIEVYPTVTLNGKATDPVIINHTTGDTFRMLGYSVPTGSVTVIDMQAHTITLNGGNVYGYWDTTSQWISLVPGDNDLEFQSGAPSDVTTAAGSYLPATWGI